MGTRRQAGPRITLPTAAVLSRMLADPTAEYYGLQLQDDPQRGVDLP